MPVTTENNSTKLSLFDRSKLSLTGVTDVSGFDETLVTVVTSDGELSVEGEGLHVTLLSLEEGKVDLEGRVNAMIYTNGRTEKNRSFWRMFARKDENVE